MKAFSAGILASTQSQSAFFKNEAAFNIEAPKEKTILEKKEEAVLAELAARREFYIKLLNESDCDLDMPGVDTDEYDGPKGSDIEVTPADLVVDNLLGSDHEGVPEEPNYDDPNYYNDPGAVEEAFGELAVMSESAITQLFTEVEFDMNNTMKLFDIYIAESYVKMVNQEALIFASNKSDYEKYTELYNLNEALGEKIKTGFHNIIEAIKRLIAQFSEKLMANFRSTKSYLDKYKDIIMNKPFDDTKFKSQDLILGIDRLSSTKPLPRLELSNANEKLDSQMDYFIAHANDFCPGENPQIQRDSDISEVLKKYYCMEGHPKEFTGKEFATNIQKVWDFLYNVKNTIGGMNKKVKEIETNCNNLMKQAGTEAPAQPKVNPEGTVYSYLYQKYFTLSEAGVLLELETIANPKNDAETKTDPDAEQQKKNEEEANKKNNEENIKAAKEGDKGLIETRCRNYAAVCTAVLKAEMSACEFIRNECMGVIRHHVKRYIGNKAEGKANEEVQNNKKEEEQKQEPVETKNEPVGGKVKNSLRNRLKAGREKLRTAAANQNKK